MTFDLICKFFKVPETKAEPVVKETETEDSSSDSSSSSSDSDSSDSEDDSKKPGMQIVQYCTK